MFKNCCYISLILIVFSSCDFPVKLKNEEKKEPIAKVL